MSLIISTHYMFPSVAFNLSKPLAKSSLHGVMHSVAGCSVTEVWLALMMGFISTSFSNTSDHPDDREMGAFVSLEPNSE